MKLVMPLLILVAFESAAYSEPLEKRFGADRERGYRSEREFGGNGKEFKNRDRANFLGVEKRQPEPEVPRNDLQALPQIGTQR